MDRKTILTDYIKREFLHDPNANLNEDEDLLSSGVLDSLGILKLVAFIEESFGIQVPDEDIAYENFMSISALASYLRSYS